MIKSQLIVIYLKWKLKVIINLLIIHEKIAKKVLLFFFKIIYIKFCQFIRWPSTKAEYYIFMCSNPSVQMLQDSSSSEVKISRSFPANFFNKLAFTMAIPFLEWPNTRT